jgi:hypothetical protein
MATTVIRSRPQCPEFDRQEIERLNDSARDYDQHSEPGCAFEAARLRRIAEALSQR